MPRRQRRTFSAEFKHQIVSLYRSGKSRKEILIEYDLTPSTFDRWVYQYNNNGSFNHADNLTAEQKEIIQLRKQLKQAEMELDILKQAALIMSRKSK